MGISFGHFLPGPPPVVTRSTEEGYGWTTHNIGGGIGGRVVALDVIGGDDYSFIKPSILSTWFSQIDCWS